MNWVLYALLGMVFFSGMNLIFKRLTADLKPNVLLLFIFIFGALFYLIDSVYTKTSLNLNYKLVLLLLAAAFLSYLGNLFYVKSLSLSPNPGHSAAINSLQIILITIGAVFLFGSEITIKNLIGIMLGIIAIILLSL